ncbi:MAG: hypothetical protein Q4D85_07365 [Corynebacterium sp.]|uniref:hypothetical protein n=1 Tax=Corynebacterium sp. TaxID=1720 RepID=UPI0026DCFED2|nr:hypothetical protein [Corynebacterium sp.]MDO5098566.1 hypothetical protein [Corynebacterium sp.]
MPNKHLPETLALFSQLGWSGAAREDAVTLPIGTPEQQKKAAQGLSSGPWAGFTGELYVDDVDHYMLALFAMRLKVNPGRVFQILRSIRHSADYRLIAEVVAVNGADYAERFIKEASRNCDITGLDVTTTDEFNISSFFLVNRHFPELGIPRDPNYLHAWALCVAHRFRVRGVRMKFTKLAEQLPSWTELESTFEEHLKLCLKRGVALWGAAGHVVVKAVALGKLPRETAITQLIASLDTAVRPQQRRQIIALLFDDLAITESEILAQLEPLSALLTTAEPQLISAFGMPLIRKAPAHKLGILVLPMLYVSTLKGQKEVLNALVTRTDIGIEVRTELCERIRELSQVTDKKVAALASTLLETWGIVDQEPSTSDSSVYYPWHSAPELWQLPRFERIPPTTTAITEKLHSFPVSASVTTVESEQCLVAFNQLACQDLEAARSLSSTLGPQVPWWLKLPEEQEPLGVSVKSREYHIQTNLGSIPCLLSEPSFIDLSITFEDLLTRLDSYANSGIAVLGADFAVALSRLRFIGLDVAAAQVEARRRTVLVSSDRISDKPLVAGEILAEFLADPTTPPPWLTTQLTAADQSDSSSLRYRKTATNEREGAIAFQAARSGSILEPDVAMNLIALTKPTVTGGLELAQQALVDAWDRGILPPGVADPACLDWNQRTTSYANIAEVAVELAENRMLAVAWHLLDDILSHISRLPVATSQTVNIAETMHQLAPSIAHAISSGQAPSETANVPGLRHYAAKTSTNKTTEAARATINLLPEPVSLTTKENEVDLSAWKQPQPIVEADTATCHVIVSSAKNQPNTIQVLFPPNETTGLIGRNVCHIVGKLGDFLDVQKLALNTPDGFDSAWTLYAQWRGDRWVISKESSRETPHNDRQLTTTAVFILAGRPVMGKAGDSWFEEFNDFLSKDKISSESLQTVTKGLLRNRNWSPVRILTVLTSEKYLHYMWPVLSECLAAAAKRIAAGDPAPKWLVNVLRVCDTYADILIAATTAGYTPPHAWEPISVIAQQKKKTAAVKKAQALVPVFLAAQKD